MWRLIVPVLLGAIITNFAVPASAQTQLLPETRIRDPRMAVIRERLQSDHGSVRPLATHIRTSGWRLDTHFIESTFENLLLEVGAEPVRSSQRAQFELSFSSSGDDRRSPGMIVETLTLTLTDLRAAGSGQVIMSARSILQCQDRRRYPGNSSPLCPIDTEILTETFLRLR